MLDISKIVGIFPSVGLIPSFSSCSSKQVTDFQKNVHLFFHSLLSAFTIHSNILEASQLFLVILVCGDDDDVHKIENYVGKPPFIVNFWIF